MNCDYCGQWHGSVSMAWACMEAAQDAQDHADMLAELAAEQANERWFEERGGGNYAGSEEEARDRWFDSLIGL